MGKRSDFTRKPRDFYPTPLEAVGPLLKQLEPGTRFFEPCAGDGALVRHLIHAGVSCTGASDIEPQCSVVWEQDALTLVDADLNGATHIITNPPWDRKILHPLIEHLSSLRPTWLLLDADWMHTLQSAGRMPWCHKIVSVGRVKWIPGTTMTGKDNCQWMLFDRVNRNYRCEFVGRVA